MALGINLANIAGSTVLRQARLGGTGELLQQLGQIGHEPGKARLAPVTALVHVECTVDFDLQRVPPAGRIAIMLGRIAPRIGRIIATAKPRAAKKRRATSRIAGAQAVP